MLRKEAEDFLQQQKKKKWAKDLSPSALDQEDISFLCTRFKDVVGGKYVDYDHLLNIHTYPSIPFQMITGRPSSTQK